VVSDAVQLVSFRRAEASGGAVHRVRTARRFGCSEIDVFFFFFFFFFCLNYQSFSPISKFGGQCTCFHIVIWTITDQVRAALFAVLYDGEFNKHKKICPERLISCPFEDSNCTVKKMKAKDLQTHKEEQYLDHLDLAHEQLFNYVRMLQKDVHDLKQEKTLLESRLQK